MASPSDLIQPADRAAFHRHIGEINRRRIMPLALGTSALLGLSAIANLVGGSPLASEAVERNLSGVALGLLVIAAARWSPNPGFSAILYGYAVLGWGDTVIATYMTEVGIGHAAHAAQQFVLYFITRYLAAMSVIWRPRDLALALVINHFVAMWPMLPRGFGEALLYPGIWTATAWLVAVMIYRAERDASVARRSLQRQHDELATANGHLARLNQEKNDLMAIAAHDLRSPLMGMTVLLNLTAAEAGRAWAAGVSSLRAIEQSCKDMADLVSRVLDAHQAEDGLGRLSLSAADIRPIVSRAVDAHLPRAAAKSIALTADLSTQPCLALLDTQAVERILDNLGSNAIKFSPRGGRVHIRVRPGDGIAGPVIEVIDSGPGIAQEDRTKLFGKFARLRARPTGGESSSGLGLYIVKRLVDDMGGTVAVSGLPGEGATFTVTLAPASA